MGHHCNCSVCVRRNNISECGCPGSPIIFLRKLSRSLNSPGARSHAGLETSSAAHLSLWLCVLARMAPGTSPRMLFTCCLLWLFISDLRRHLQRLPWFFHCRVIRDLFRPFLKRVRSGDIVWIHNRPEFAVAITPLIHRAGGRVVLHLHNSHLVNGPEQLMEQVRVDRLVFVSEFLLKQAQSKFPLFGYFFCCI